MSDKIEASSDARLTDPTAIILLLRDAEANSPGHAVQDFFHANPTVWDPWHQCFLITDLCPLTAKEQHDWFDEQKRDRYAVLCLPDANGERPVGRRPSQVRRGVRMQSPRLAPHRRRQLNWRRIRWARSSSGTSLPSIRSAHRGALSAASCNGDGRNSEFLVERDAAGNFVAADTRYREPHESLTFGDGQGGSHGEREVMSVVAPDKSFEKRELANLEARGNKRHA